MRSEALSILGFAHYMELPIGSPKVVAQVLPRIGEVEVFVPPAVSSREMLNGTGGGEKKAHVPRQFVLVWVDDVGDDRIDVPEDFVRIPPLPTL